MPKSYLPQDLFVNVPRHCTTLDPAQIASGNHALRFLVTNLAPVLLTSKKAATDDWRMLREHGQAGVVWEMLTFQQLIDIARQQIELMGGTVDFQIQSLSWKRPPELQRAVEDLMKSYERRDEPEPPAGPPRFTKAMQEKVATEAMVLYGDMIRRFHKFEGGDDLAMQGHAIHLAVERVLYGQEVAWTGESVREALDRGRRARGEAASLSNSKGTAPVTIPPEVAKATLAQEALAICSALTPHGALGPVAEPVLNEYALEVARARVFEVEERAATKEELAERIDRAINGKDGRR